METQITDGRINLRGNLVSRARPKKADYILYINANHPIAIVEAKDNRHAVGDGLQQAMTYAQMLDVPFAYSSNAMTVPWSMTFSQGRSAIFGPGRLPTAQAAVSPASSWASSGGKALNPPGGSDCLEQPYYSSQNTYPPRYYQRDCHQPYDGRHRPGPAAASSGDGHRNGQNLYRLSDRLPAC